VHRNIAPSSRDVPVGTFRYGQYFNALMAILKPHSNGQCTVIGTLAVDGWAVTFGTARRDLRGLWPGPVGASPLLAVPNVTTHPSTASVPTSYTGVIRCGTIIASDF